MPILFSAVVCEGNILAHFASCEGNFMEITEQVVSRIPPHMKMTYSHGIYLLHYSAEEKYFYFCITDRLCQRSRAFLFLNKIQRRYKTKDKGDFTATLASEMYRYSEDYTTITIRQGELDEVNSIGVGCSESILGEKILYVDNPEKISYCTISHVGKSPEKISVSINQSRMYAVIIGVLALIIGLAYALGPLSCAVLTGVAAISLLRTFVSTRSKEE